MVLNMTLLKFVMSIHDYNDKVYKELLNTFSNTVFPYDIYNCTINFKTELNSKVIPTPLVNVKETIINLTFRGELAAEVNIEDNSVLYYDGPKNLGAEEITVKKLHKYFKHDRVDENFEGQMELICLQMVHSIVLSSPWLNINCADFTVYIDENKFLSKRFITCYPIQNEAYEAWPELFNTKITINQTWNWLIQNKIHDKKSSNCPVVSFLSYLLNRDYHEIMLYSVIGLEAIYGDSKNKRSIAFTLQNRIHRIFPNISMDQVKKLYKARSRLAHGDTTIGSYDLLLDLINGDFDLSTEAIFASALFIGTLRMLIANNAVKIDFIEKLQVYYSFK